jgi:C-methyltransferase C-terminal domain/Putative zinc binding domain
MGPMPLANSFLSGPEQFADEPSYPLDLYFCETCSLVQLLDVIDPELLFRNYIYVTGTSDTMAGHNRRYASTIVDLLNLQTDALVVEVASNDGSLLKCFQGLTTLARYERFAKDVEKSARTIRNLLIDLKERGKTVAGYGAPAKGNTLLNYGGIGVELLPYTVDKNPRKVNLYTPGMHIPVLPTSVLLQKQPDYLFILAWNFTEEIMKQQREYREHGGQFIVPLPEPKVVPACNS